MNTKPNLAEFKKDALILITWRIFQNAETCVAHAQNSAYRGDDYDTNFLRWKDNCSKRFYLCDVGSSYDHSHARISHKYTSYQRKKFAQDLVDSNLIVIEPSKRGAQIGFSISPFLYGCIFNQCVQQIGQHDYMQGIKNGDWSYSSRQLEQQPETAVFIEKVASGVQL